MGKQRFVIGLAPLYLKLYDDLDANLRSSFQTLIHSIEVQLGTSADVIVSPIITTSDEVNGMTELFKQNLVDAIFTLHLTYSPSLLIADKLQQLNIPLVLISTSMDSSFSSMNENFLMQNHGIHGVMDLASVLQSKGIPYQIVAGHYMDSTFQHELAVSIRILKAVSTFRNQRIGLTGTPFPLMGDFAISFDFLAQRFGMKIEHISEDDIAQKQSEASDDQVKRLIEDDRNMYETDSIDEETHQMSVRGYLALQSIVAERELSAYTMSYLDIKRFSVPFYAVNRLMSEGYGYAGEGDVLTASLGRSLNLLSPKAMFTEFFCPDWDNNLVILSHMGEIDPRFAQPGMHGQLVAKQALGSEFLTVYHRFQMQSIPLTFVCFARTMNDDVKLVIGLLDVVDQPLFACFPAPHFVAKPRMSLIELLRQYSLLGGGHHIYVAEGDITREIKTWSNYLDIEVNEIMGDC